MKPGVQAGLRDRRRLPSASWTTASCSKGCYRNPGTHAAGVVIGEKPLIEIIPLARDKDRRDRHPVHHGAAGRDRPAEDGLPRPEDPDRDPGSVSTLVKRIHGIEIDLDNLPLDDQPTYELLNRGDTVGVFQLESGGMRDLIRRIGIDRIEDLIAMIALYRPGPDEHAARLRRPQDAARPRSSTTTRCSSRSSRRPTASWSTRNRSSRPPTCWPATRWARPTSCAAPWARRSRGDGRAAREVRRGLPEDQQDRRRSWPGRSSTHMAKFAGYGFNKAHSAGYAHHLLPDRLPEGQLPGRVHGRPALQRNRQLRQAARSSSPKPRRWASRSCRPTSTPAASASRPEGNGDPLRPGRHQERRARRRRGHRGRARGERALHGPDRLLLARRQLSCSTRRSSRAWSAPGPSTASACTGPGCSTASISPWPAPPRPLRDQRVRPGQPVRPARRRRQQPPRPTTLPDCRAVARERAAGRRDANCWAST